MNKVQTESLEKVDTENSLDWVEIIIQKNNFDPNDPTHIRSAKAILNLRKVKGMFKSVEDKHKKVVDTFMKRRILPVQEGHILLQWVERSTGFDEEKAKETEPAAMALYTDLLTRFKEAYPKSSHYVDVRYVKEFVE